MGSLTALLPAFLLLVGLVLLGGGAYLLARRHRDARYGRLVAVDEPGARSPLLRSVRWGLTGRPDELRRSSDGRLVPIEFKSRASPRGGVPSSHRVQVATYCLLVEETTGRAPPFGVVRYGDGGEFRIPWDGAQRAEVLAVLTELRQPYDGRATPSRARCARCPWREVCDRRAL